MQARACKRASIEASSSFLLGSVYLRSKVFSRSDMSRPTTTFFITKRRRKSSYEPSFSPAQIIEMDGGAHPPAKSAASNDVPAASHNAPRPQSPRTTDDDVRPDRSFLLRRRQGPRRAPPGERPPRVPAAPSASHRNASPSPNAFVYFHDDVTTLTRSPLPLSIPCRPSGAAPPPRRSLPPRLRSSSAPSCATPSRRPTRP